MGHELELALLFQQAHKTWVQQNHPIPIKICSAQALSGYAVIFFFNWSIAALQYCVSLCLTGKWISHKYIYIYIYISSLFVFASHLGHHRALSKLPCAINRFSLGYLFYIYFIIAVYICQSQSPNPSHFPPSHLVSTRFILYICFFISTQWYLTLVPPKFLSFFLPLSHHPHTHPWKFILQVHSANLK